jgi:hypothetical protein
MATEDKEIKKIKNDIKLSGFPLEVLISSILIKSGWSVENQVYYFDETEKKNRTVDMIATKPEFKEIGDYDRVNFSLVLDCKKSITPWVFYTIEKKAENQILDSLGAFKYFSNPDVAKSRIFIKWLAKNCHYSYVSLKEFAVNYYEPFKNGEGKAITTAFHQVTKAYEFRLNFTKNFTKAMKTIAPMRPLFIFYPMVVFDGHLYECKPEGKEINVYRRNHLCYSYKQENSYIIDIVEKDYFEEFLKTLDTEISCLKQALEKGES